MQRQQQKLPLFKPITNTDISFQTFESFSGTRMKDSISSDQLSRNTNEVQKGNQNQQQSFQDVPLGTERLTSLHEKLHHEADKIRKWKVQTEMDLKQKEKKLTEAQVTIESLRKSILEVQLENENLSTKLQDELSSREEVFQRIHHTRNLITLLKEQEDKLEDRLVKCETERTELKYLEKEHAKQFEELTGKFKQLEIDSKKQCDQLSNQALATRERQLAIEEEMKQKLAEANTQIMSLTNHIDEKDISLRDVHASLQKSEEKIHTTNKMFGEAQQRIASLSGELTTKEQQLQQLQKDFCTLQNEKEKVLSELKEEQEKVEQCKRQEDSVQEALNNSVVIFNQQQDNMQRDIETLKSELTEEQNRLKETRAKLTESLIFSESLKSSRDVLLLEKTEMELCLGKLKTELTDLQSEKYKNKAEISSLEAETESLQTYLEHERQLAAKFKNQLDQLEREKKHLNEEVHKLKNILNSQKAAFEQAHQDHSEGKKQNCEQQETIKQLNILLQEKEVLLKGMQDQISDWKSQLLAKENDTAISETKVSQLAIDFQALQEEQKNSVALISELEIQIEILKKDKELTETKNADLLIEIKTLQKESGEKDHTLETEVHNRDKKLEILEKQLSELQRENSAKNKHVKELEIEVNAVRSQMASKEREDAEHGRELVYLRQELVCLEQSKEESETLINSLQEQIEKEKLAAHSLAQQIEHLKAEALKDQKEALAQSDRQIIEMTATLEKYTQDHQRLVLQKDKEIEELRNKNKVLEKLKKENDKSAEEERKKAEDLQKKLENIKMEMEHAGKKLMDKEMELKMQKEHAEQRMKDDDQAETNKLRLQLAHQEEGLEICKTTTTAKPVPNFEESMEVNADKASNYLPQTPLAQISGRFKDNIKSNILRQAITVSKRRKVAFITPSPSVETERHGTESDSSAELEVEAHLLEPFASGSKTPLRLRHSPGVKHRLPKSSAVVFTFNKHSKLISSTRCRAQSEIKDQEFTKSPNMRKAPNRTSKFFRTSPKERTVLKKKEMERERLSWFDEDNVFGFGPED